jgi:DNA-directed RNA polymerase subunit E'/Rpb7
MILGILFRIKISHTMEKLLYKTVCLEYKDLDKNIVSVLLKTAKNKFEGMHTKEDGYITEVKSIKISDNYISASSQIIFNLILNAVIIKPEIGNVFTGKVKIVHNRGVIVIIYGKMVVLIPDTSLPGYTYNASTSSFEKDGKKICEGTSMEVKITVMKYEENKFKCIGHMV